MIREIFLPDSIRGYYIFPQRIVGFDVGKTHVSATQIYAKGTTKVIEKYIEESIESGPANTYAERASAALLNVRAQLDSYDKVRSALSSSVVIFKELKLPFLTYEKIKMVVHYEIEPLLPFSINDAVIDFIITKQNPAEGTSEILVAAVQNQHIAQHLQIFETAGISPEIITVDLFALYGFYQRIPLYPKVENIALIDLGLQATRIAFIQDGQLRFIRTIAKGMSHSAKEIADLVGVQPNEAMDHLIRFGVERASSPRIDQATTQALTGFWQEIQFTLQSFTTFAEPQQSLSRIFILGEGSEIKGITDFVSSLLNIPTQLMLTTDILNDPSISIKNKIPLPSSAIISLSTALLPQTIEQFNLRQGSFALEDKSLINKQIITGIGLLGFLLGALGIHSYMQIRKFKREAQLSRTDAIAALKERPHFTKALDERLKGVKDKQLLNEAISTAQDEVKRQEEMWFALAGPTRHTFLKYLLELNTRIDKDALGFNIESVSIADGVMTIKASVKDHNAIKVLVKELEDSKLFSLESKPETTSFTLKMNLAKNNKEQE